MDSDSGMNYIYTAFENIVSIFTPNSKNCVYFIWACRGYFHRASAQVAGGFSGDVGGATAGRAAAAVASVIIGGDVSRGSMGDIGGAAAGAPQAAAAVASVIIGGDVSRGSMGDIGWAAAGVQQTAAAAESVIIGGDVSRGGMGDIGGAAAGSATGRSSGCIGEQRRWRPGRPARHR